MNKLRKSKKQTTIIIIIFSIISLIFLSTIAYSAFSSTMNITGLAHARVEADARITDFRLASTNNATSSYEEFGKNHINSNINLSSTSSTITYYLEITNYGITDIGIYNITGLPTGLNYQIKDYNLKDKVCDIYNKCNSFITRTYELIISTNNSSFDGNIKLEFEFRPFYKINYVNFNNNYQSEIISGDSLIIDLSKDNYKFIEIDSSEDINYNYLNFILTLNNVTSNVEVTGITEVHTYNFTGNVQTFRAPIDGVYQVELWGASGVDYQYIHSETIGNGGYTSGKINLTKGTELYVYVGSGDNERFNGSGRGEAPGGGATDIRLKSGSWDNFNSLKSRIMVAGAGGGGVISEFSGITHSYEGDSPGHAGGLSGYDAYYNVDGVGYGYSGYGGGQTFGGNPGKDSGIYEITSLCYGRFGFGGYGLTSTGGTSSSGAGSGYYGGGHGVHTGGSWTGAGGGSSFISGHKGCDAIKESSTESNIIHTGQSIHYSNYSFLDTIMIDGAGYKWTSIKETFTGMPTYNGTGNMIGNKGNGYAKITLVQTEKLYGITYTDINGSYQNTITEGNNLVVNFSSNAPSGVTVLVDNNKITNYSYQNGTITIPNVSGNIEIIGMHTYTYNYTGDSQTFIAPRNGVYKVELWGAQGGYEKVDPINYPGAYGGYTKGNIELSKDKVLYVYVGEQPVGKNLAGGYNGGGNSVWDGSGGGGATDIRLDNSGVNNFNSLKSRIMVAGGGGGGYNLFDHSAGGLIGYSRNSENDGGGGTQISGGQGGDTTKYTQCGYGSVPGGPSTGLSENGKFGLGGNAYSSSTGGGGGYYGGGSGIHMCIDNGGGSGGGGSSFISGHNGCDAITESSTEESITHTSQSIHYSGYKFTNTVIIDGQGYKWTTEKGNHIGMPTHDGTGTMPGNSGGGYAKITLIEIKK